MIWNLEPLVNGMRGNVIYALFEVHSSRKLLKYLNTLNLQKKKYRSFHSFSKNLYLHFHNSSQKDKSPKSNIKLQSK